jgi:hypothetical protein
MVTSNVPTPSAASNIALHLEKEKAIMSCESDEWRKPIPLEPPPFLPMVGQSYQACSTDIAIDAPKLAIVPPPSLPLHLKPAQKNISEHMAVTLSAESKNAPSVIRMASGPPVSFYAGSVPARQIEGSEYYDTCLPLNDPREEKHTKPKETAAVLSSIESKGDQIEGKSSPFSHRPIGIRLGESTGQAGSDWFHYRKVVDTTNTHCTGIVTARRPISREKYLQTRHSRSSSNRRARKLKKPDL